MAAVDLNDDTSTEVFYFGADGAIYRLIHLESAKEDPFPDHWESEQRFTGPGVASTVGGGTLIGR